MKNNVQLKIKDTSQLAGVGGWLLLFCVSLTILTPLMNIIQILRDMASMDDVFGEVLLAIVVLGPMIYSIVIGIQLWLIRPRAVRRTRVFLIINLCISVTFSIGSMLLASRANPSAIFYVVQPVLFFVVWWNYFKKSIRVGNTYKEELASTAPGRENDTRNKENTIDNA